MLSRSRQLVVSLFAAVLLASPVVLAQDVPAVDAITLATPSLFYSENAKATCDPSGCYGGFSFLFKAVPMGYRLVVTHVSVHYVDALPSSVPQEKYAILEQVPAAVLEYLPAFAATGPGINVISCALTYYVAPGASPSIVVRSVLLDDALASVTGYLVAIPPPQRGR